MPKKTAAAAPKKRPAYKTAAKKPAAPALTAGDGPAPVDVDALLAAERTGNVSAIRAAREALGLSAPPVYRDALVRTSRKVAK